MKYKDKMYYSDTNQEVLDFNIKTKKIDKNYKYLPKNPFLKFFAFLSYRLFATPFAWIYFKLIKRIKFKNKKVLKQHKKDGYFIYANHTNQYADGFCPSLINFPKKPYLIVNPSNVFIPVIGKLTRLWGALPLPDTLDATRNFNNAMQTVLNKNCPILIYPEAHLWPYYTKIRDFSSISFKYPIKYKKPVYCFTTVYKKPKKIGRKPKMEIYVDGPFYPDFTKPIKEAQEELKQIVFNQMLTHSEESNYEYLDYIKKD